MSKMRQLMLLAVCLTLTTVMIANAFYQRKQFYPSVVYITKSNTSMMVIYVQAFALLLLIGKCLKTLFFGELRPAEAEHLMERMWYAVTETCLAFTVFRDDFSPKFVVLFSLLLFFKTFHWLAEDRVDFMERSPVISTLFHVRVLSLMIILGFFDISWVTYACKSTISKGPSVQIVFGLEYAILCTNIISIATKYVLRTIDLMSETPWENKTVFLLYVELLIGFVKVVLYLAFVMIMVRLYTLPLFAFRPIYQTLREFKRALNDVVMSRRAIRNMNTLYPDATPEELASGDNVCIICREDMRTGCKKLPCGHIFHKACLRSWFQRQQTCPTCRFNILQEEETPAARRRREEAAQQRQNPQPPPPPSTSQQPTDSNRQQRQNSPGTSSGQQNKKPKLDPSNIPWFRDMRSPNSTPPLILPPFCGRPPIPPSEMAMLSDDDLRAMEGETRAAIEARIKALNNIQLMLDSAIVMMNHYYATTGLNQRDVVFGSFKNQKQDDSSQQFTNEPGPSGSSSQQNKEVNQPSTSDYKNISKTNESPLLPATKTNETEVPTSNGNSKIDDIRKRRIEKFTNSEAT